MHNFRKLPLALIALPGAAFARPQLVAASPAANASVAKPTRLTLGFSEALQADPQIDLALGEYEILVRLSEQADHRMRMSLLAEEVVDIDGFEEATRAVDDAVARVLLGRLLGHAPDVAPAVTSVPPGTSDLTECRHTAAPTVSRTASTRS